jgi:hypothetical protein
MGRPGDNGGRVSQSTIAASRRDPDDRATALQASHVNPALPSIGTEVQWRSHGGSGTSEKHGRVLCHVPAGTDLTSFKEAYAASHDLSAVMLCGCARKQDSVLVEVVAKAHRKPRLYWPRLATLTSLDAPTLPPMACAPHAARQLALIPSDPARRLAVSGRWVDTAPTPVAVPFTTRCPGKWVFLDLETRQAWVFDGTRFRLASDALRQEAQQSLAASIDLVRGAHVRKRPRRARVS